MSLILENNEIWHDVEQGQLFFNGSTTDENLTKLTFFLNKIDNESNASETQFFINSSGGISNNGFSLMHFMSKLNKPVQTIGMGLVASSAIFVFLGGSIRTAYPNTKFMIHLSSWSSGEYKFTTKTLQSQLAQNHAVDDDMLTIIAEKTGIAISFIKERLESQGDWYLTAIEARAINLIQNIK